MVAQTSLAVGNKAVSQTMTVPAPTGGINARDSLAMMQPNEAISMTNYFPLQYGVRVRKGFRQWVEGLDGSVETLMTFYGLDGVEQMFAAVTDGHFYDVTDSNIGVTTPLTPVAPVGSTIFGNARWQWVNMTNEFGTFLIAVNGEDNPQYYNGTIWQDVSFDAVSGLDPTKFINIALVHRRLWFVEKDTGDAWYMPIDQISGTPVRFGVGEVFPRGGFLQAVNTWATTSGSGLQDNTVFVSSEGDVAVFTGFDPDATVGTEGAYTLAATYRIGATFCRRCTVKYSSDLWILCEDGIFPMSGILSQSTVLMAGAVTNIIQLSVSDDITAFHENFGWEMFVSNRNQFALLNVPVTNLPARQWVMNQVTNKWTQFTGYDAFTFGVLNNDPYFGGDGVVQKAWDGDLDNYTSADGGKSVSAFCQQAYNSFGQPALQKRWTMIRPIFNSLGFPGVTVGMNTNYNISSAGIAPPPSYIQQPAALWDDSLWDVGTWGGGLQNIGNWYSANQLGYAGSIVLQTQSAFEMYWIASDFISETGSVL